MRPVQTKQILIVAGASGAGKTTFLDALARGRLPESIRRVIPEGAADWPQSSFKTALVEGLPRDAAAGGIVLHYNLMRAFAMNLDDYRSDPAVHLLDEFGGGIVVATIVPDEQMLTAHILRRAEEDHRREKSPEEPLPRQAWRSLRRLALRATGNDGVRVKPGQQRLIELYNTPGGLQAWLDKWDAFLEELSRERPGTRVVRIAPDRAARDKPNFRLAAG